MKSDSDMSPQQYMETVKENPGVLIDVRTKMEYNQGHLKGTDQLLDFNSGEFHQKMNSLDKDKTYYLYCRTGNRSGQAARIMKNAGFEQVYNIGGFDELVRAGLEPAE